MLKALSALALTILVGSVANAASKTVLKCAGNVVAPHGARINLLQAADGSYRANLIFGTTVSGQMFSVFGFEDETYVAAVKGKENLILELTVSSVPASNKFIKGTKASLRARYTDLNQPSGMSFIETKESDQFVCGKQISDFRG